MERYPSIRGGTEIMYYSMGVCGRYEGLSADCVLHGLQHGGAAQNHAVPHLLRCGGPGSEPLHTRRLHHHHGRVRTLRGVSRHLPRTDGE